jgi:hypothetical protein
VNKAARSSIEIPPRRAAVANNSTTSAAARIYLLMLVVKMMKKVRFIDFAAPTTRANNRPMDIQALVVTS